MVLKRENRYVGYKPKTKGWYAATVVLVLLCGWGENDFVQVNGEWQFVLDGDGGASMEKILQGERAMLKPEHRELPAKFLIFYGDITDEEKYEQAKACPYFYCVFSPDEVC